jgi:competence protein ComEA
MGNFLKICAATLLISLVGFAVAAVELNTASAAELAKIKGLGPVKAQAIVDFRAKNGPFKAIDDLKLVKGIGAATLQQVRGELVLESPKSSASKPPAASASKAPAPASPTPKKK